MHHQHGVYQVANQRVSGKGAPNLLQPPEYLHGNAFDHDRPVSTYFGAVTVNAYTAHTATGHQTSQKALSFDEENGSAIAPGGQRRDTPGRAGPYYYHIHLFSNSEIGAKTGFLR
jgi:hypothetical protein